MPKKKGPRKDKEHLRELIAEATVDCYDEEEQLQGFMCMIEEHVICPFKAKVVSEEVRVTGFESERRGLRAVCERKGKVHRIGLDSLEWIDPNAEGFEWIEAYLAWKEWGY